MDTRGMTVGSHIIVTKGGREMEMEITHEIAHSVGAPSFVATLVGGDGSSVCFSARTTSLSVRLA